MRSHIDDGASIAPSDPAPAAIVWIGSARARQASHSRRWPRTARVRASSSVPSSSSLRSGSIWLHRPLIVAPLARDASGRQVARLHLAPGAPRSFGVARSLDVPQLEELAHAAARLVELRL